MTVLAAEDARAATTSPGWAALKRIAFRFACAYWIAFLVTYLPGFFDDVDPTSWISKGAPAVLSRVVP